MLFCGNPWGGVKSGISGSSGKFVPRDWKMAKGDTPLCLLTKIMLLQFCYRPTARASFGRPIQRGLPLSEKDFNCTHLASMRRAESASQKIAHNRWYPSLSTNFSDDPFNQRHAGQHCRAQPALFYGNSEQLCFGLQPTIARFAEPYNVLCLSTPRSTPDPGRRSLCSNRAP